MKTTTDGTAYSLERLVKDIPMSDAIKVAMSRDACDKACRACPRYGRSWACPPFELYDFPGLHPERFDTLRLVVTRINTEKPVSMDEGYGIFLTEKQLLMPQLYQTAREKEGIVYGFAGTCDLCSDDCTRSLGQPCRHPDLAGPALEAAGFDVSCLLREFFGLDLVWSDNGNAPDVMTYVAGIAYINKSESQS